MSIGKKLKLLRKAHGYSQVYVATKLHIARSTYSAYENNKAFMDFFVMDKIIKLYNIDANYLFDTESTDANLNALLEMEQQLEGDEEKAKFRVFIMRQGQLYFDFLKIDS